MSVDQYNGPFKKTVALFTRRYERTTVHRPHSRPGVELCSLSVGDKFWLFARNTLEPSSFFAAGFVAGISQARNDDAAFGQEAGGYGKRIGAAYADIASDNFFGEFFYPAIFREDPRYYRMKHGRFGPRLWHAMRHTFVARSDSGKEMFNFSQWLATASSVSVGNLYHPDNRRGFGPAAENMGIRLGIDMGFDVLREFLPDIFRKLKMPFFRPEPGNGSNGTSSAATPRNRCVALCSGSVSREYFIQDSLPSSLQPATPTLEISSAPGWVLTPEAHLL